MLLACIGMSWVSVKIQQARQQKAAVEAIKKLGGWVKYDYQRPKTVAEWMRSADNSPGPAWLRRLLGDDFFTNVVEVVVEGTQVGDAALEHLKGLTQLQYLSLDSTQVTDAGLEHLKGLTQLQKLSLNGTKVTDAGLEHLKGLTQLQGLSLNSTKVTGAGLEHLKGLTHLQTLSLYNTQVTDAGLKHLKGLTQLQGLSLGSTQVTDAGLEHLNGLTQLQGLSLDSTQVTDAGLEQLKGLAQLQVLSLRSTKVTDEGVKRLKQALPNCQILHGALGSNQGGRGINPKPSATPPVETATDLTNYRTRSPNDLPETICPKHIASGVKHP